MTEAEQPIAAQLRARREELGLLQKQVAHMLGITPAMVSMVESGKRPIPSNRLVRWLRALSLGINAAVK